MVIVRKLIKKKGNDFEKAFSEGLAPDLSSIYSTLMPITYGPVDKVTAIYDQAAKALFPNDPEPLRQLGAVMARETYSGVYKILMRIPTAQAVISRAAKIWRTFFDTGEASVENLAQKSDEVVVRGFPELPKKMLDVVAGNLSVIIELTGRKNVKIQIVDNDPQCWRWKISWD